MMFCVMFCLPITCYTDEFVYDLFWQPDLFRQPVTNSTHKVVTHSGKVVYTNIIHYYYCTQNSSSDSSIR